MQHVWLAALAAHSVPTTQIRSKFYHFLRHITTTLRHYIYLTVASMMHSTATTGHIYCWLQWDGKTRLMCTSCTMSSIIHRHVTSTFIYTTEKLPYSPVNCNPAITDFSFSSRTPHMTFLVTFRNSYYIFMNFYRVKNQKIQFNDF